MNAFEKIKQYFDRGAEQVSRKHRIIGVPPELPGGQTFLDMLRERDPIAWKQHENRAKSQLIHADEENYIALTDEEFNIWLELRGCKPLLAAEIRKRREEYFEKEVRLPNEAKAGKEVSR